MKNLARLLHALMCDKEHATHMEDIFARESHMCYWYLEEKIADASDHPDRTYWENEAENLCETLELAPHEVLRVLNNLAQAHRLVRPLLDNPKTARLVSRFLRLG